MRVIAGKARHLNLKTVPGNETRPTTDRIKETLFNMLAPYIPGSAFLDLFAGSGGIGIEALSRGADRAVFVEQAFAAARCIEQNLAFTGLAGQAKLMRTDVFAALGRLGGTDTFDIVFMDPPYRHELEKRVLTQLSSSPLIGEDSLIIVEAAIDTPFDYLDDLGYDVVKRKEYKTNAHMFLRRRERHEKGSLSGKL